MKKKALHKNVYYMNWFIWSSKIGKMNLYWKEMRAAFALEVAGTVTA